VVLGVGAPASALVASSGPARPAARLVASSPTASTAGVATTRPTTKRTTKTTTKRSVRLTLQMPVWGPVSSPFGLRRNPITHRLGQFHQGWDIAAAYGAPIRAAAGGVVTFAGWSSSGFGKFTVVDHGGGVATTYGHQSRIVVRNGQKVKAGQVIGYVGSTGASTGPHLDLEVRVNGVPVDPARYLLHA